MNISIVGAGRAGSSFGTALELVGHDVRVVHHEDASTIADAELIILCVPDDALSSVALSIAPREDRVIAHVAGSPLYAVHVSCRESVEPIAVGREQELGRPGRGLQPARPHRLRGPRAAGTSRARRTYSPFALTRHR